MAEETVYALGKYTPTQVSLAIPRIRANRPGNFFGLSCGYSKLLRVKVGEMNGYIRHEGNERR
jgi:hypothetical protein